MKGHKEEPGQAEVLQQTWDEWKEGRFEGPWEAYLNEAHELPSNIHYKEYMPTERCPVIQNKDKPSYDARPIDN